MDEQEVLEILSELKTLKSEMERGTVTVISAPPSDALDSTVNKWTLKRAIYDIRKTIASSLRIKTNGTQLLARILSEAKRVCDQTVSFTNYVDLPFEKEKGLALEMNKCVDDACSVLEETKKLRRELDALKLRDSTSMANTDSTSRLIRSQSPELRGTKLLTTILADTIRICDDTISIAENDDRPVRKEDGLSVEMNQCIDEACLVLEHTKSMKRGKLEDKKTGRFIETTLDKTKELHAVLFQCDFKETDEIKGYLETKCDGNKRLFSLFLSGNIVKRCHNELESVKSLLLEACQKYASECIKQSSLLDMSRSVSEYVSKVAHRCKVAEDKGVEMKQTLDQFEVENANLRRRCKGEEDKSVELKQKHSQLKEENANLRIRLADMKCDLTKREKSISLLQEGQETLLNRLSQYTSAQLTHENPNVADLSGPNRPTKIGEQLSELYDNQWTDAFGTLTDNYCFCEEKAVTNLRNLLDQAYAFCMVSSGTQDRIIKLALHGKSSNYITSHKETAQSESDLAALEWKMIFDLKKRTSDSSAKTVGENFFNHVKKLSLADVDATSIEEYVIKCAEVCWHMVLQSPQLYMESCYEDEETFNTNKYKHYKTKGTKYKFIVWPALYLHKDGPMLSKGIAEAKGST